MKQKHRMHIRGIVFAFCLAWAALSFCFIKTIPVGLAFHAGESGWAGFAFSRAGGQTENLPLAAIPDGGRVSFSLPLDATHFFFTLPQRAAPYRIDAICVCGVPAFRADWIVKNIAPRGDVYSPDNAARRPGDLLSMSRDCDGKFAERFDTEYLLVVQDDGFPLRSGLDEFIGRWDFIGPPYVRDRWLQRLVAGALNLWTANGGFSLRTHKMCELAAWYFKKRWHKCMDPRIVGEDAYYTETLLKHHWKYNRTMKMADNRSAVRFAWDILVPQKVREMPFGFHRAETFAWLSEHSSAISARGSEDGQTVFGQNQTVFGQNQTVFGQNQTVFGQKGMGS